MQSMTRHRQQPVRGFIAGTTTIIALALGAVGCGDDNADTIALADWVNQFEQACLDVAAELSTPGLTEEEFTEISIRAIADMRAIPEPDELADTAAELLDALEANSDQDLDDATIAALDEQVINGMTELGVSDDCIGGEPGG